MPLAKPSLPPTLALSCPISPVSAASPHATPTPRTTQKWIFKGTMLHATPSERSVRARLVSLCAPSDDLPVIIAFAQGGRLTIPRSLLSSSQTPLTSLFSSIPGATAASFSLYDDTRTAFATLARFLACASIHLPPLGAPDVCATASRWHVPVLARAAFATLELSDLDTSVLAAWVRNLNSKHFPQLMHPPPRFLALLARRLSILLPAILRSTRSCRNCTPVRIRDADLLSSVCAFCAGLEPLAGLWHALVHMELFETVMAATVRLSSRAIAADILTVLAVRLRGFVPVEEAVRFLRASRWPGWPSVVTHLSDERRNALGARGWRILAEFFADERCLPVRFFAAAFVHVQAVARAPSDTRRGVAARGEPVGKCTVHLATVWAAGLRKDRAADDTIALRACVRVEVDGVPDDSLLPDDEVRVSIDAFADGCACEMGCAFEAPDTPPRRLHGDIRKSVVSTWRDVTSDLGVQVPVLGFNAFRQWCVRHEAACGLLISAQVFRAGCGHALLEEDDCEEVECEPSKGAPKDSDDIVCACVKCREKE